MRMGKRISFGILGIIMAMVSSFLVQAEGNEKIFNSVIVDDTAYIYTLVPDNCNNISCQIGTEEVNDITITNISDIESAMETYLLVDNSLSIKEEYRERVKEIAQAVISGRAENESITLATFDTELHVLADKSEDTHALTEIVRQIEYKNLDTKLTDVLYQLYKSFESGSFNGVRRIIIISDGAEYQKVGYTQDEVLSKVKKYHYPIYTIGCRYNENESELENMFRLSRDTNGEYWLIDEIQDISSLTEKMNEMKNTVLVEAKIPETMGDGSEKGIKLTFHTDSGNDEISFKETMPFMVAKEMEQITETVTETETITIIQTEETEELTMVETETELIQETNDRLNYVILLVVVAAIVAVIVFLIVIYKKKQDIKEDNSEDLLKNLYDETQEIRDSDETQLVNEGATEILFDDQSEAVMQHLVRLTDMHNPSVIREISLEPYKEVCIGRKRGAVDIAFEYERTVSSRHCALRLWNGDVYIKDLRSSNGTIVDGVRIEEETVLYSGSILKLGNLQLKFELLKLGRLNNGN